MQNEQCGICWDLEFDKQGNKTHEELNKYLHDFITLDYCVKCRGPKFDQYGFQTHLDDYHDFMTTQNTGIAHKFISGIEAKYQE